MSKLQKKAAIVTGATSGMGRAAALLFAREGAAVLASGRDVERGATLVEEVRSAGGRAQFVAGDISEQELSDGSSVMYESGGNTVKMDISFVDAGD